MSLSVSDRPSVCLCLFTVATAAARATWARRLHDDAERRVWPDTGAALDDQVGLLHQLERVRPPPPAHGENKTRKKSRRTRRALACTYVHKHYTKEKGFLHFSILSFLKHVVFERAALARLQSVERKGILHGRNIFGGGARGRSGRC